MKKPLINYLIPFVLAFLFSGCQDKTQDPAEITVDQFISIQDKENFILLDVRTSQEYKRGHLQDAILLDVYTEDAGNRINQLDKNKVYYVYCHTGVRSRSVVNFMRSKGFKQVYDIRGGIIQLSRKGVKLVP